MSHAAPGISAVFAGLAVHLWAEATGRPAVRAVSKLVASAGFLAVGIAASDGSRYAGAVLAALVLSAAGDALRPADAAGGGQAAGGSPPS